MNSDSVAQDQLKAFVERIERMEEEKKAIADDIKEIYAEAKSNGFSVAVIREIVKIRKKDHSERMEFEAVLDLYLSALGMQAAPFDDDDAATFNAPAQGEWGTDKFPTYVSDDHDPITGEVLEDDTQESAAGKRRPSELVTRSADESVTSREGGETPLPAPNSPIALGRPHAQTGDAEPSGDQSSAPISAPVYRFNAEAKPIRPHCQNPGPSCAGEGRNHCYRCRQIAAGGEAA